MPPCDRIPRLCFRYAFVGVASPSTRMQDTLLGPCFKTGRLQNRVDSRHAPPHHRTCHLSRTGAEFLFMAGFTKHKRGSDRRPHSPHTSPFLRPPWTLTLTPRSPPMQANGCKRFPGNIFTSVSLSFQSAFHLSLAVLVNYRLHQNI